MWPLKKRPALQYVGPSPNCDYAPFLPTVERWQEVGDDGKMIDGWGVRARDGTPLGWWPGEQARARAEREAGRGAKGRR